MNDNTKQDSPFYIDLNEDCTEKKNGYAEDAPEGVATTAEAAEAAETPDAAAAPDAIKAGIEIGRANEALKKAKALIDEARRVAAQGDPDGKYLKFSASVGWSPDAMRALGAACPQNAFDYFGLEAGDGCEIQTPEG